MFVRVDAAGMRKLFVGMTMNVNMCLAVTMTVFVKMNAIAPKPPQHIKSESNQHNADRRLDWPRHVGWNGMPKQDRRTGKREQCECVAKTPCQAMLDDVSHACSVDSDARDCGDMIGLKRVLHSKQEAQPQDPQHTVLEFTRQENPTIQM